MARRTNVTSFLTPSVESFTAPQSLFNPANVLRCVRRATFSGSERRSCTVCPLKLLLLLSFCAHRNTRPLLQLRALTLIVTPLPSATPSRRQSRFLYCSDKQRSLPPRLAYTATPILSHLNSWAERVPSTVNGTDERVLLLTCAFSLLALCVAAEHRSLLLRSTAGAPQRTGEETPK